MERKTSGLTNKQQRRSGSGGGNETNSNDPFGGTRLRKLRPSGRRPPFGRSHNNYGWGYIAAQAVTPNGSPMPLARLRISNYYAPVDKARDQIACLVFSA
eukprot:scaffold2168_cov180-Amphora_coffeaeformis.AAC.2